MRIPGAPLLKSSIVVTVILAATILAMEAPAKLRGVGDVYSSGDIDKKIPDLGRAVAKIKVPKDRAITDLNVQVRMTHQFADDLLVGVKGPGNQFEELVAQSAADGPGLGTGAKSCGGSETVFDSQTATPIAAGASPYAGSYQPSESLDVFNTLSAEHTWKLYVFDLNQGDSGTLHCWKLDFDF